MNAVPVISAEFADELLCEIDRRTAAEKFVLASRVRERAPFMHELERQKYAQAFESMAAQLMAAAAHLRVYRPEPNDMPEFLRVGSTVPLRGVRKP